MLSKKINLIVACQELNNGIGINGKLPWISPIDMNHFKKITTTTKDDKKVNAVIMGRKTFNSIGKSLPGRINYVLTKDENKNNYFELLQNIYYCNNLQQALVHSTTNERVESVFVIGGGSVYEQVMHNWSEYIDTTFLTTTSSSTICDTFFNMDLLSNCHYLTECNKTVIDNDLTLKFYELKSRNKGEDGYLELMRKIINKGSIRHNRTGIDTISLFGERMEFDISNSIPFLTTKKLAWKTMMKELLWFISGDTNNKTLQSQNVKIWNGNSTREYLDSIGLTDREEGDLGPIYGFQWRHFGAEYTNCNDDYSGKGIDQLANVVNLIRNDPDSRRIIMSAWNPSSQPFMALPPCHIMAQWYVRDGIYLDCQMYQRSCDVALGVPFNIASYSLLTYMLAHVCNLKPGKYIQILGDAHIYTNHLQAVKEQLKRIPFSFPTLQFNRKVDSIDNFVESDFILTDYKCHSSIKMDMAV